jgi:2,4-dichlorophenol 6-monooxygenase
MVHEIEDLTTGQVSTFHSRFLVGADGAGSAVRRSVGLEMEGPDALENFVAIHARADLSAIVEDRPATLYWITDPATQGNVRRSRSRE